MASFSDVTASSQSAQKGGRMTNGRTASDAHLEPQIQSQWAPTLATAAAVTAAAVMQAAEMAALAVISEPAKEKHKRLPRPGLNRLARPTRTGVSHQELWLARLEDPDWGTNAMAAEEADTGKYECERVSSEKPNGLGTAATLTAAAVTQVAEMTAVAVIKGSQRRREGPDAK